MLKNALLLITTLFVTFSSLSQNIKPRVALVLSGGGAKGIAHIPVLQALDSLGIVPDLIVGNSMGSIVGGLYAMGYSGNEIAALTLNADWDDLMGGKLSLNNVSNEEKSEFNQYLVSAAIYKKKIKINPYILSDQNLRTYINSLTYPVYRVSDFDSLPIPFRAIATDIVAGKEVVLDSGSLALAMRASMSIPAVFSAVPYKNTLLIDGGVLNNFPVDVAKTLGAEFIIGSDVGTGMLPKEQLDNLQSLLFQSGMIASNIKNPNNRALCDILLSHGPNLTYSTSDFIKASSIYKQGHIALEQELPKLIAISRKLKTFKQREIILPVLKDSIVLDTIFYKGISSNNLSVVKARSNIKTKNSYTEKEIIKGIKTVMGTALFSKVEYGFIGKDDKTKLFINASEISNHQIKGTVHYDNQLGAGLILNYTGRNLIGSSSRSLVTIDMAKNPKIRLQHQNIFGKNKNWWMRSELFVSNYLQEIFTSGFKVDEVKYGFVHASTQFNRNLSSLKSYVGLGIEYESSTFKPSVPAEILAEENDDYFNIIKYKYQNALATFRFNFNTINSRFFATKGNLIKMTYKRSLNNQLYINFFGIDESEEDEIPNLNNSVADYHKVILEQETRISVSPKLTTVLGFTGAFVFEDKLKDDELLFYDYVIGGQYFLGGNNILSKSDSFLVPGLREGEILSSQFLKGHISLQYAFKNKLYILPHMDIVVFGTQSFSSYLKDFAKSSSNWDNDLEKGIVISTGITASYDSFLGPINIDASFVNGIDKMRFFVNVGYSFAPL